MFLLTFQEWFFQGNITTPIYLNTCSQYAQKGVGKVDSVLIAEMGDFPLQSCMASWMIIMKTKGGKVASKTIITCKYELFIIVLF